MAWKARWNKWMRALQFYREARTIYDLHSPALYRITDFILDQDRQYYDMARLRPIRDELHRTGLHTLYEETDQNTLPEARAKRKRRLQRGCCSRDLAHCLFRMTILAQPKRVLYLGAGNGMDSLFVARAASPKAHMDVTESDPVLSDSAEKLLNRYAPNVHFVSDPDHFLLQMERSESKYDLIILGRQLPDHLLVEPDILTDRLNMERGSIIMLEPHHTAIRHQYWQRLKDHPMTRASLLFWSFGLAMNSTDFHDKISFKLIPWWSKPWQLGLWGKGTIKQTFPG